MGLEALPDFWKALAEVQEGLGVTPGGPGGVGRSRRGRKALPEVQEASRGSSGGPGEVQRTFQRSRRGHEGSKCPPIGSEWVERPSPRSG